MCSFTNEVAQCWHQSLRHVLVNGSRDLIRYDRVLASVKSRLKHSDTNRCATDAHVFIRTPLVFMVCEWAHHFTRAFGETYFVFFFFSDRLHMGDAVVP